jgi:hypothetical protein
MHSLLRYSTEQEMNCDRCFNLALLFGTVIKNEPTVKGEWDKSMQYKNKNTLRHGNEERQKMSWSVAQKQDKVNVPRDGMSAVEGGQTVCSYTGYTR